MYFFNNTRKDDLKNNTGEKKNKHLGKLVK